MFSSKALRSLILPLIAECFLSVSLGIADSVMISSVGEAAMSGVSLVDMLNVFIINLFNGLATGGAVIAAQYIGKKSKSRASDCASNLILLSLVVGLVFGGIMLLVRRPVLKLLFGSIEADVMESAVIYLTYSAFSFPIIAVYSAACALFRSMGNSSISMKSSLVMNIINIGGNAILIYVVKLGVAGTAIATVTSRFVAMIYLLIRICDKNEVIHVNFKGYRPNSQLLRKILYIGIPSCFENSIFQLGKILVMSIISVFGTVQIAANAAASNLAAFGCIPGQGLQLAMITVVGQCLGARDKDAAMSYTKKLMKIASIATLAINILLVATMPFTLKLYSSLSPEAEKLATILVLVHASFAVLLWPTSFVLPNALRAAGDVRYAMVVSIISMVIMRVLFSYILGLYFGLGALGVWISMILDWVVRAIAFLARFRSRKWLKDSLV